MTAARRRRPRWGFTLLEVLVALSILAITLLTLYQAFSASLFVHSSTRGLWDAMVYVHNELARWERSDRVPGREVARGAFEGEHPMAGYRWRREVSDEQVLGGVTVRKVSLRLTWDVAGREQSYQSEIYVAPR